MHFCWIACHLLSLELSCIKLACDLSHGRYGTFSTTLSTSRSYGPCVGWRGAPFLDNPASSSLCAERQADCLASSARDGISAIVRILKLPELTA